MDEMSLGRDAGGRDEPVPLPLCVEELRRLNHRLWPNRSSTRSRKVRLKVRLLPSCSRTT